MKAPNALIFDTGNALFAGPGVSDEKQKARASFVMATMAKLGTRAMAVGHRDLAAGSEFLLAEAKKSGLTLLSANLTEGEKHPFAGSLVVPLPNGLKVALVGLTAVGPVPGAKALTALATADALDAELKKVGKRDLTVVLAATSYADAQQLATQFKGRVDLIVQSGEFRGTVPPQNIDSVYVLASGQKGQAVGKVELNLDGTGPFVDVGLSDRAKQQVAFLDSQLRTLDERVKAAQDPSAKADLARLVADMKARRDEQQKAVDAPVAKGTRTLKNEWLVLGSDVKDDEALKAEVLKIDPAYSGSH